MNHGYRYCISLQHDVDTSIQKIENRKRDCDINMIIEIFLLCHIV